MISIKLKTNIFKSPPIIQDIRSYCRPFVRTVRGRTQAAVNDLYERFGFSPKLTEPVWEQWRRIMRKSKGFAQSTPTQNTPRILFASGWGLNPSLLAFESIIAMALKLRGANPFVLKCDKVLPACEFNQFGNFNPNPGKFGPVRTKRTSLETCRICTDNINDNYQALPISNIAFRDFFEPKDLDRAFKLVDSIDFDNYQQFKYRGINVGENAFASVMRAMLRATLEDTQQTRWLFRRYLVSSILVTQMTEQLFSQQKPDRVVEVHGIYVTQGTIREVALKWEIPVIVHGTPYRINTVWLSHQDTYHRALITDSNSTWENTKMTPVMNKQLDDYIADKRLGGRDYAAYHKSAIEDPSVIKRDLKLDNNKPVISLFTNVLWDAQLYYKYNAFTNMLDWLHSTIEYFISHPEIQLAIRIHPAEAKSGLCTNQPILAEILGRFPSLPSNIHIIPAESNISSYALAELSNAALIYGARMGMEIALLGTPLIIAGESINRRKGYSYDVESREEYFRLLDRVHHLPRNSQTMIERARKYAYHFYFRIMLDFPLLSVANLNMARPTLKFKTLSDLMPEKSKSLDLICKGILDAKTPFYADAID